MSLTPVNFVPEQTEPLLLTVEDASILLNISKSRVFDLCRAGKLRSVKLGKRRMIPRKCVVDFVEELTELANS